MAKSNTKIHRSKKGSLAPSARMLAVSKQVSTADEFARFMSTLMTDLIAGKVTPQVGNAACNAGGKLLKVVDMQYKLGRGTNGHRQLALTR